MDAKIKKHKYKVIKNFIDSSKAIELAKQFEDYCERNAIDGDEQVKTSKAVYNYIPFVELLTHKVPEISQILGESVLPTYCYARVYNHGSVLENHTDRPSCEISLTVHLHGDKEWPIYLGNGDRHYVNLEPGDAIIYLGTEINHGREEYSGNNYTQCFLHYVRVAGEQVDNYFDNKKVKTTTDSDYIKVYDNIISDELCDLILSEYTDDQLMEALTSDNKVKKDIRNCYALGISNESAISLNEATRRDIDNKLFLCASQAISKYRDDFNYLEIDSDTGYDILRYDVGGFYAEHIDYYNQTPRVVSCSFALNDDYEGGEFAFFGGKKKIKLKKGSAILFPSNFMFPHQILPVQKGTRYSIITWFK